ncbi:hypothetical protein N7530_003111, partial [Penicillium desertorum]
VLFQLHIIKDLSTLPISSHGLVVKRMTSNHEILGSTPSTYFKFPTRTSSHGLVVKRITCNDEIRGSIPRVSFSFLVS